MSILDYYSRYVRVKFVTKVVLHLLRRFSLYRQLVSLHELHRHAMFVQLHSTTLYLLYVPHAIIIATRCVTA